MTLVLGVGLSSAATGAELSGLIDAVLDAASLSGDDVRCLATVAARATDAALVEVAARAGWGIEARSAEELDRVPVPTPSRGVRGSVGTASVAEAAALAVAGADARLVVTKQTSAHATVAVAATADPLRHHGDAEAATGMLDLAVNVRRAAPPEWLRDVLVGGLADLGRYPDPAVAGAAVAARHGRPPGEVLLTAGAAEGFVLLARALRPRHAVVVHPQFTEPEAALRGAGHDVDRVVLDAASGFVLDPGAVPASADLVVIGNPTNPTSVLHPGENLRALARPGRTLVVDEAFMDAVPGEAESLAAARDVPGLVVVRSLTKTWGLAGLRVGYLLAAPETVGALRAAQPLWAVSTLALLAAQACSAPAAVREAAVDAASIAADRDHLLDRLASVGLHASGVSRAPFVLVRHPRAGELRARLRERGIAVRRGDTFPGLGPEWLRIAVRPRETTDALVTALHAALTEHDPTPSGESA